MPREIEGEWVRVEVDEADDEGGACAGPRLSWARLDSELELLWPWWAGLRCTLPWAVEGEGGGERVRSTWCDDDEGEGGG